MTKAKLARDNGINGKLRWNQELIGHAQNEAFIVRVNVKPF